MPHKTVSETKTFWSTLCAVQRLVVNRSHHNKNGPLSFCVEKSLSSSSSSSSIDRCVGVRLGDKNYKKMMNLVVLRGAHAIYRRANHGLFVVPGRNIVPDHLRNSHARNISRRAGALSPRPFLPSQQHHQRGGVYNNNMYDASPSTKVVVSGHECYRKYSANAGKLPPSSTTTTTTTTTTSTTTNTTTMIGPASHVTGSFVPFYTLPFMGQLCPILSVSMIKHSKSNAEEDTATGKLRLTTNSSDEVEEMEQKMLMVWEFIKDATSNDDIERIFDDDGILVLLKCMHLEELYCRDLVQCILNPSTSQHHDSSLDTWNLEFIKVVGIILKTINPTLYGSIEFNKKLGTPNKDWVLPDWLENPTNNCLVFWAMTTNIVNTVRNSQDKDETTTKTECTNKLDEHPPLAINDHVLGINIPQGSTTPSTGPQVWVVLLKNTKKYGPTYSSPHAFDWKEEGGSKGKIFLAVLLCAKMIHSNVVRKLHFVP